MSRLTPLLGSVVGLGGLLLLAGCSPGNGVVDDSTGGGGGGQDGATSADASADTSLDGNLGDAPRETGFPDAANDRTAATDAGDGSTGCPAGTADCNGRSDDGCETDTTSDLGNCGGCGKICQVGDHASAACVAGICGAICAKGWGDCDVDPTTGCEADLLNDATHCGGCRIQCTTGVDCIAGGCACASSSVAATRTPLDIYLMVDQSGSMSNTTGGVTQWSAVAGAVSTFMALPQAAGIGLGVQYFPLSATDSCYSDGDCGKYGPCNGAFLFFPGSCALQDTGDSCLAADYGTPDVGIGTLPGVAAAIDASFAAHGPTGATPTYPAVQGALDYAKSWIGSNPSHTAVVVLATDGEPNECSPYDVGSIASLVQGAATANPKVLTFVIGVGSSLTNLNAIAAAGGTGQAYIVDTNGNAAQQFLAALQAIQGKALGCDYQIPLPEAGTVDYAKIDVKYTPGGGVGQLLAYVTDASQCGAGGWYYDVPAAPTKIVLCGPTCDVVKNDPNGAVDIVLGCRARQ